MLSKLPVFQAVNTWCPNFRTLTVEDEEDVAKIDAAYYLKE